MEHLLIADIAAHAEHASMHALQGLCPEKTGNPASKERKYWMRPPVTDGKKSTIVNFTTVTIAESVLRYALTD
jgi:hypothetical protein